MIVFGSVRLVTSVEMETDEELWRSKQEMALVSGAQ